MRIAVVSDIHSNLPALEAVLENVDTVGVDEIWCLGDIVGYGPDPEACVNIVRERCSISLSGNHDLATTGSIPIDDFNRFAARANLWTMKVLDEGDQAWLRSLPTLTTRYEITLAHGSPREPVWEYVVSAATAQESFRYFDTDWCLVGHSHLPLVIIKPDPQGRPVEATPSSNPIEPSGRVVINPGSVGQPRDGDPRASYAILDLKQESISHFRVAYEIASVQERMRKVGLPSYLIERLEHGY